MNFVIKVADFGLSETIDPSIRTISVKINLMA